MLDDQIINLKKTENKKPIEEIRLFPKTHEQKELTAGPTIPRENKEFLSMIFRWEAKEFEKITKTKEWFWAGAILGAALLIVAIIQKNFLFAIVVFLAGFLVYIYSLKEPKKISFAITNRGVVIGKRLYEYDNLKSFWIFYEPPRIKELSVESKKHFVPRIAMPLDDADPVKLREALIRFLPEVKQEEDLSDIIARGVGF